MLTALKVKERESLYCLLDKLFNDRPMRLDNGAGWFSGGYGANQDLGVIVFMDDEGQYRMRMTIVEDGQVKATEPSPPVPSDTIVPFVETTIQILSLAA